VSMQHVQVERVMINVRSKSSDVEKCATHSQTSAAYGLLLLCLLQMFRLSCLA